jgi:hypothetical protein
LLGILVWYVIIYPLDTNWTTQFLSQLNCAYGWLRTFQCCAECQAALSWEIQDQVTTMPVGQPANDKPEDWYEAVALCNENRITNAAFFSAKPVPTQHTTLVCRVPQMFLAAAP